MPPLQFPPVESAGPEGILAVGGDLTVSTLLQAYQNGVFPWPTEDYPLLWFAPPQRAILRFDDFKIPRRLRQELKKKEFHFKIDENFPQVIRACSKGATRKQKATWITQEMIEAYCRLHEAGYAHSFECYDSSGKLAGGLYGVGLGGMFAGESMFFLEPGASKAALIFAVETLRERGGKWMDIQMMSPLLATFGAAEVPRKTFTALLREALKKKALFPPK
ncbi:MAG: leucyl/phenylalanyl-tRNA--protein transferase [bacterium]